MNTAKSAVIASLGFFALVAQALLFRDYLAALEGSEIAVGAFYGTWLLWVAAGALFGRWGRAALSGVVRRFDLVVLLYIPAYLLQHSLIVDVRALASIAPYDAFPLGKLLVVSLVANAPTSLLTGWFFAQACEWASKDDDLPPARVYMFEALGSAAGGVSATLMLASGAGGELVFVIAAAVLISAAGAHAIGRASRQDMQTKRIAAFLLSAGILTTAAAALSPTWSEISRKAMWERLLPVETYRGSFATAQATYLHGTRHGQFIVTSWGGVCETLPAEERASETIAIGLSQIPDARSALVVGPNTLAVALGLLDTGSIESVTWLHPDPEYPHSIQEVLPAEARDASCKLIIPGTDARAHLRSTAASYDLVILNMPDATTLVLNRYFTVEFFELLRGRLSDGGVVALNIRGGENYLGGELALLGASALHTLESVFEYVVLKPGDDSWLIASQSDVLSDSPAILRRRFEQLTGAKSLYPPQGLASLFQPSQIEYQIGKYRECQRTHDEYMLLNTDATPRALLFGLLLSGRKAGISSFQRAAEVLAARGAWMLICAIAIYALMRWASLFLYGRGGGAPSSLFDGGVLVFTMGSVGMSLSVVLIFTYQSLFGSLYLHMGLISALFMLGSFIGCVLSKRALARSGEETKRLLPTLAALHLIVLLIVAAFSGVLPWGAHALLFLVAGGTTGMYFPVVAQRLKAAGGTPSASGSTLELLDHLGGATGGFLSGVLMLPVLGTTTTVTVLAAAVAANLAVAIVRPAQGPSLAGKDWFDRLSRSAAFALFGIGTAAVLTFHLARSAAGAPDGVSLADAARELIGDAPLVAASSRLSDGREAEYFTVTDEGGAATGYVIASTDFSRAHFGYAGPMELAVAMDSKGRLSGYRILCSEETPVYVERLSAWNARLEGQDLFSQDALAEVDAVTGATLSAEAIRDTIAEAGATFAGEVLGLEPGRAKVRGSSVARLAAPITLIVLLLAAAAVRFAPGRWRRVALLTASVLLGGLLFNTQYSAYHITALLTFPTRSAALSSALLLVIVLPIAVALFGNIYCGYVCPFGALSELLGEVMPSRLQIAPAKHVWRYSRAAKYVLLFYVVALVSVGHSTRALAADPLVGFFAAAGSWTTIAIAVLSLAASTIGKRFWCRNLCPSGAFLALFARLRILRHQVPGVKPGYCDLGVRSARDFDCICCDRCTVAARETPETAGTEETDD